jgi:glyceraldehyde 3-phosphate dehydrogenase
MKTVRVAINGAGRIGRSFYKLAKQKPEIEVVAFNDLAAIENIAYLLKYDTVYGVSEFGIETKEKALVIDGKEVKYFSEKDPTLLPWKDLDIDVVVESTGVFTTYEKAKVHLDAGAKRVVVTAPMKDDPLPGIEGATILMGINEEKLSTCQITSNASCTTNAGSPLIAILDETLGIEKAVLNTVHGYTASQALVDGPSKKDLREGRAAAQNIVPSSTGAAIAVTKAFPKLSGLFDGISMRVPVVAGSMVDITFIAKRETTAEEVNAILKKAATEERWKDIFAATEEELVSSDIIGSTYGSIVDLQMTRVVGGNLVKVLAWYDNEMGYCHTLVNHVTKLGSFI